MTPSEHAKQIVEELSNAIGSMGCDHLPPMELQEAAEKCRKCRAAKLVKELEEAIASALAQPSTPQPETHPPYRCGAWCVHDVRSSSPSPETDETKGSTSDGDDDDDDVVLVPSSWQPDDSGLKHLEPSMETSALAHAQPSTIDPERQAHLVKAVRDGLLEVRVLMLCPFGVNISRDEYGAVSEVPDSWPCTCGAEHLFSGENCELMFRRPAALAHAQPSDSVKPFEELLARWRQEFTDRRQKELIDDEGWLTGTGMLQDLTADLERVVKAAKVEALAHASTAHDDQKKNDLGLSIDMLDVDRLRKWADNFETYGPDVTHWGGRAWIIEKLREMAGRLESTIRDIGKLRAETKRDYEDGRPIDG